MTTIFKPLLATDYDPDKQRYPCVASPKLDGVRGIVRDGIVYSRSNKPIPNRNVQEKFGRLENFDGELIVGDPCSTTVYRDTVSIVMSHDKPSHDVRFIAFDHIERQFHPYRDRRAQLIKEAVKHKHKDVHIQCEVLSHNELVEYEAECLTMGYEGLILRDPDGFYKMGRSTVNEGILLKVKQFVDDECVIIGFEERMRNDNEAVISELGRTKRSSHQAGKHGRDDLGSLIVRNKDGVVFNIGTGFNDAEREHIWQNQNKYLGKFAKYKFFPVGVKEAPRHPVWLGLRDPLDM